MDENKLIQMHTEKWWGSIAKIILEFIFSDICIYLIGDWIILNF